MSDVLKVQEERIEEKSSRFIAVKRVDVVRLIPRMTTMEIDRSLPNSPLESQIRSGSTTQSTRGSSSRCSIIAESCVYASRSLTVSTHHTRSTILPRRENPNIQPNQSVYQIISW